MVTVNIIGGGRLGKTFGYLLHVHHAALIQSICNTHYASSQAAVDFMGAGVACAQVNELQPADVYLITTPDSQIRTVCEQIVASHTPLAHSIFMHCSGLLKSDILASAKAAGYATASFHPAASFADPAISITQFAGTFCTLEGDNTACATIASLFEPLKCLIIHFAKEGKTQYHAASVFATNYVVPLFYHAVQLFITAGIPADIAKTITSDCIQKTIANINAADEIKAALTGPINRGDIQTIMQHLAEIDPAVTALYRILGRYILPLTDHDANTRQQLLAALYS